MRPEPGRSRSVIEYWLKHLPQSDDSLVQGGPWVAWSTFHRPDVYAARAVPPINEDLAASVGGGVVGCGDRHVSDSTASLSPRLRSVAVDTGTQRDHLLAAYQQGRRAAAVDQFRVVAS